MSGHGAKFGRKKDDAIAALLTHRNIEEAAGAVKVSPKTLLRWMKDPEFDAAYRDAKRQAFSQSIGRLQQAWSAAVTTVLKLMVDQNAPASTRLRAADIVMERTSKAIELEDIEARLAALELAAGESDQSRRR